MKHATAKLTLAAGLAVGGLCAFTATVGAQGIGVDKFERMLVPTDRKIERGRQIYDSQCAGCHGPEGRGQAEYPTEKFGHPTPDFTTGDYRHGGGLVEIYNVISKGLSASSSGQGDGEQTGETSAPTPYHPTYSKALRYRERWAVAHYVRSLAEDPSALPEDPPAVRDQARLEAKRGTCNPEIKSTIASRVEPEGDEQLATGKQLYESQCTSCHGDNGKGDGPAGQALEPSPRNFHGLDEQWTNGTSPLNIFNSLTNGIDGTAMASYASLSEEKRWALTHYVRQWIPEEKRQEATDEDIMAVCRTMSKPAPPEPITVDRAIDALIADQPEDRHIEVSRYGPARLAPEANARRGEAIYRDQCADCHGEGLQGDELGPLAVDRAPSSQLANPQLYIDVRGLKRGHAGGSFRQFATRASAGVHATLPGMDSAALMTEQDWKDLQAFVAASVEGDAERDTLHRDRTSPGDESPSDAEDASPSDADDASPSAADDAAPTEQSDSDPSTDGPSSPTGETPEASDDSSDEAASDQ